MKISNQQAITQYAMYYVEKNQYVKPLELATILTKDFSVELGYVKEIINGLVKAKIITYTKSFDTLTFPVKCRDCGKKMKYHPNENSCADCLIALN